MSPLQELKQKILQKYGWCAKFDVNENGEWYAEVILGPDDLRRFTSSNTLPADTHDGRKKGILAAAQVAIDGLREDVKLLEALPVKSLVEVFPKRIDVYSSNSENWDWFWNHKPKVVGIDTEGNQISPPVLVQISVDDYTILETPRRTISKNLRRLLSDDSIVKVFCDNSSHKDKTCLGLKVHADDDFSCGSIVDLETLAARSMGATAVDRGLPRIVTLCMPELKCLVRKPKTQKGRYSNIGRFALIEQGKKPPLRGIHDLSDEEQQYAALDSWATLQAYKRLQGISVAKENV